MFVTKSVKFCRKECHKIYLVGEHFTAFMYAVCEFVDAHLILIGASLILLFGIILIAVDQFLNWFGITVE
jgi:hypothetical protein